MKKLVATILSVSLIGGAMLGLAGCGLMEEGSKVDEAFDNAYKATLAKNFTVERSEGTTFAKEEAAANAKEQLWTLENYTYKVDYENKLIEVLMSSEQYVAEEGEGNGDGAEADPAAEEQAPATPENPETPEKPEKPADPFKKQELKAFLFGHKDKYYMVTETGDATDPWTIQEIEKEKDFLNVLDSMVFDRLLGEFRSELDDVYNMRNIFTLNEETSKYELTMANTNLSLLANESTAEIYRENVREKTFEKMSISAIGATSITVPDDFKQAVDDYIAAQAPEAPQE